MTAIQPASKPNKAQKQRSTPADQQYRRIVRAAEQVAQIAHDTARLFEQDKSEQWGEQVEEARDAAEAARQAVETCRLTWAQMQQAGYQPPVLGEFAAGQQVWPRNGARKRMLELYSPEELACLEVQRAVGKKWLVLKIRSSGQTFHVKQGEYTSKEPRA